MGLIRLQRALRSAPALGREASDWWMSNGLVALFDVRAGVEVIGKNIASSRTSSAVNGAGGVAADFSGTANQQYAHREAYALTGAGALLILCDIDALSGYGALIAKQATTTTAAPYELRLGAGSTDSRFNLVRASGSSFVQTNVSASNTLAAGERLARIVISWAGSGIGPDVAAWVNGTKYSVAATDNANSTTDNGSSAVWIGRRYDGATQLDGRIYHIGLLNRPPTDDEAQRFTAKPFGLFRDKTIWVPVSSGGGPGSFSDSRAESFAFGDSSAALVQFFSARSEAMAALDSSSSQASATATTQESSPRTDSSSTQLSSSSSRAESMSMVDTSATGGLSTAINSESVALVDTRAATASFVATWTDALGLTHAQTATASLLAATAETAALTHAQTTIAAVLASITEPISITSVTDWDAAGTQTATTAESVSLTHLQSTQASLAAQRAEAIALLDASSSIAGFIASRVEALGLADAAVVGATITSSAADAMSLADSSSSAVISISFGGYSAEVFVVIDVNDVIVEMDDLTVYVEAES